MVITYNFIKYKQITNNGLMTINYNIRVFIVFFHIEIVLIIFS